MKFIFLIVLIITCGSLTYFYLAFPLQSKEARLGYSADTSSDQDQEQLNFTQAQESGDQSQSFPSGDQSQSFPSEEQSQDFYPSENYLRVILYPIYRVTLSSEVIVTTVERITKRMGESFKVGELLIKLDDTIYAGLLIKAQGLLQKAKTELSAKQQLYRDGIASIFEIKAAESDLASAESDIISAQYAVDACVIKGPFDGEVVNLFVEEHELIQQGKPLIEIVDDSSLVGKVLVPSTMLDQFFLGKEVKVKVKEINKIVTGNVLRIDSVIDPASSTIKVDIEIKNPDKTMRGGMIGLMYVR